MYARQVNLFVIFVSCLQSLRKQGKQNPNTAGMATLFGGLGLSVTLSPLAFGTLFRSRYSIVVSLHLLITF